MPTFFLDENLHGKIVSGVLRKAGLQVEQHKDHFKQGVNDEVWLPEVAQRGWIAVTCDVNTRFARVEVESIIRSNAQVIHMINGKNATHPALAQNFINSLGEIYKFIEKHQPPFLGVLVRPSRLEDFSAGKPGRVRPIDLEAALRKSRAR
ncbi:MAG: hypothetical protein M3511_03740 [Deinococcota bacterium]|nr:hypothetical protein [Deinococcota bacterium]